MMMFESAWSKLNAIMWDWLASTPWGGDEDQRAANSAHSLAAKQFELGMKRMGEAGDGRTPAGIAAEAAQVAAGAFKDAMDNPVFDTSAEKKQIKDLWDAWAKAAAADKAAREARKIAGVGAGGQAKPSMAAQASGTAFFKPVVSSLQRIGGGRVGESIGRQGIKVALDRTRNKLLTSIDRKIGLGSTAVFS